jgi:hypothetical protein
MSKADRYRRFAASSLELAQRTSDVSDKSRLLAMAEAWLDLADRISRPGNFHTIVREDPAIRTMFGRHRPEAE